MSSSSSSSSRTPTLQEWTIRTEAVRGGGVTCKRCSISIDVGQFSVRWRSPDGLRSLYHHPACLGIPAAVKIVNSNYSIGVDCDLTTEQVQRIKQDILAASEAGGGGAEAAAQEPASDSSGGDVDLGGDNDLFGGDDSCASPSPPRPGRPGASVDDRISLRTSTLSGKAAKCGSCHKPVSEDSVMVFDASTRRYYHPGCVTKAVSSGVAASRAAVRAEDGVTEEEARRATADILGAHEEGGGAKRPRSAAGKMSGPGWAMETDSESDGGGGEAPASKRRHSVPKGWAANSDSEADADAGGPVPKGWAADSDSEADADTGGPAGCSLVTPPKGAPPPARAAQTLGQQVVSYQSRVLSLVERGVLPPGSLGESAKLMAQVVAFAAGE